MKKKDISGKLFHILMPILLGMVESIVFKDYLSFIETLKRSIEVPTIVFPIVWSMLYLLIGVWYDFFEDDCIVKDKMIYYILLIVNLLFVPILFYFEKITLALIVVIVLIIGTIYLFIKSKEMGKYGYLLLPYIIWLMCAFVLMVDLFVNNIV